MWRVLFWLSVAALAVPALTLTVARAFDTDNGTMIRIESFTPLALPLYAALVVLLAVRAALRHGDRKPLMAAALAALALLVLWTVFPQRVFSCHWSHPS